MLTILVKNILSRKKEHKKGFMSFCSRSILNTSVQIGSAALVYGGQNRPRRKKHVLCFLEIFLCDKVLIDFIDNVLVFLIDKPGRIHKNQQGAESIAVLHSIPGPNDIMIQAQPEVCQMIKFRESIRLGHKLIAAKQI